VEIVIARDARKVLARIQPAKAKDIREAIDKVAADPNARKNNLRTLKRRTQRHGRHAEEHRRRAQRRPRRSDLSAEEMASRR
jgi:hypothetical protein